MGMQAIISMCILYFVQIQFRSALVIFYQIQSPTMINYVFCILYLYFIFLFRDCIPGSSFTDGRLQWGSLCKWLIRGMPRNISHQRWSISILINTNKVNSKNMVNTNKVNSKNMVNCKSLIRQNQENAIKRISQLWSASIFQYQHSQL